MFFFGVLYILIQAISASPLCGAASAMVLTADLHLAAWNRQLEVIMPGNCTQVHQFLYASHARVLEGVQTELSTLRESAETSVVAESIGVSSLAAASSLLSAQMHGISYLTTNFKVCFDADRDLKLITLVLLRHTKSLQPSELRAVWLSLQNGASTSPEKTQFANIQFLQRAVDVYAEDLPILGTVVKRLIDNEPRIEDKRFEFSRMEIVEAVYDYTFNEKSDGSQIFNALFKAKVLDKGDRVADFAATFGNFIAPLRESGIFKTVDAFDAIDDIETATHGKVLHIADSRVGQYKTVFALNVFDQVRKGQDFFLSSLKKSAEKYIITSVAETLARFAPEFAEDVETTTAVREALSDNDPRKSSIHVLIRIN
jgi:hypothetical protein